MADQKKQGLFNRLTKRISNIFQPAPRKEAPYKEEKATSIKPPTEETKPVSKRPSIRFEGRQETQKKLVQPSAHAPSEGSTAPERTAYSFFSQPEPKEKKEMKTTSKLALGLKKRKRLPNERLLREVFRAGQYLSHVHQRKRKKKKGAKLSRFEEGIEEAEETAPFTKTGKKRFQKNRLKKGRKGAKIRLTEKALELLERETVIRNAPTEPPIEQPTQEPEPSIEIEKKESEPLVFEVGKTTPPLVEKNKAEPIQVIEQAVEEAKATTTSEKEPETRKKIAEKELEIQQAIIQEIKTQRKKKTKESLTKKPSKAQAAAAKQLAKEEAVRISKKMEPEIPKGATEQVESSGIEELKQLVSEKFSGQVDQQKIEELQRAMEKVLARNLVTRSQMEENIRTVDANRLLEGFTKLISLIEVRERFPEPEKVEIPSTVGLQQRPEKRTGVEKELEKKELITDFDKILEIVRERGSITLDALTSELKTNKKNLKEAVDILEENNLVIQEYPAFGPARITDPFREKKGKKGENA